MYNCIYLSIIQIKWKEVKANDSFSYNSYLKIELGVCKMKKNLTKITTIILLVFSMILTNFSMIVRAAEPKAQGTQSRSIYY